MLPGAPFLLQLKHAFPPRAVRLFSSEPLSVPLYSMEIAPPPPAPKFVMSPPRASIEPLPARFVVVIQTEPPAPLRSLRFEPFAQITPSSVIAAVVIRTTPPPFAPQQPPPAPASCG